MVTDFVNETSDALLSLYPNLHIQFGLHATSVKDKMKYLKNVDSRVEILWEDCGTFPYHYEPEVKTREAFEETLKFTEEIINLREVNPIGLVYKGQMTMDWFKFINQCGPYVLGRESKEVIKNDYDMMKPIWRVFQAEWMQYGEYAHEMTNKILELTGGNVNMNLAGTLSGGIWFPFAMTAQLFWDCTIPYKKMREMVLRRHCLEMA